MLNITMMIKYDRVLKGDARSLGLINSIPGETSLLYKMSGRRTVETLNALFAIVLLPGLVYLINKSCNKTTSFIPDLPSLVPSWHMLADRVAYSMVIGWVGFQTILANLPTSSLVHGRELANGKRLLYRCNGFQAAIISIVIFCLLAYLGFPVTIIYDKLQELMASSVVIVFIISVALFTKSLAVGPQQLSQHGNTGNTIHDFFMGRELNPRVGNFDVKFFLELRPGMIGWMMINLSFLFKSIEVNGSPSPALCMVAGFHMLYVLDALWFESSMLSTIDIIHEGLGYMLVFGDLVWVPFTYTLTTRYLLEHRDFTPCILIALIFTGNMIGYFIFRSSNHQKSSFRKNPTSGEHVIVTRNKKNLLVSGWWGRCHHPNYLGDIIMAYMWSLPCGFQHPVPYFYPVFLTILLTTRERRDNKLCREKYGADWDEYCRRVRYRIVPGVY